ncbi:S9 family peptidase [Aciditerrimonas ferrireducens]|uniref:S9 family peptidase n=1 Tax=Aciditerrimonas ferrireducens TaxID=667306 RepID=A0ABV6C1A8_9ACTN
MTTDRPSSPRPRPPRAPSRSQPTTVHGQVRLDPWAWLADLEDPAVLAHLRAEQAHTEQATAPLAPLAAQLFEEIRARVAETDRSVPVAWGPWWYYRRTLTGLEYALHCRAPRGPKDFDPPDPGNAPLPGEQVVLDENRLADGAAYLDVADVVPSPDHRRLAYTVDLRGAERYVLHVRLADQLDAPCERIAEVAAGVVFLDDRHLLYTRADHANRPWQVLRHRLGDPPEADEVLLREPDERFHLGLSRTKDGRYVLVESHAKVTSEIWVVPTDDPGARPAVLLPRREGVSYVAEHHRGWFLLLTDDQAPEFRVCGLPAQATGELPPRWRELVPHRPDVHLEALEVVADHLVLAERAGASPRLSVLPLPEDLGSADLPLPEGRTVPAPPDPAACWLGPNPDPANPTLRYEHTSLLVPRTTLDLDLRSGRSQVRKQQDVLGGYDPDRYDAARLWARAPDGERIPVSVVRRADVPLDGRAPCLLIGYGAYGHSLDPVFSSARLSLLDRGVTVALAHVRGGGELGRRWWEGARLTAKPTSFTDLLAVADRLVDAGWADPERIVLRGASAGGLLVGATLNLAPERFAGVVAEVPFVDCLTTMLDPTLPLTVTERDEWGNPLADPEVYRVMASYAPYDNVRPVPYPPVLATGSLEDSRVGCHEPAKWVQRLRAAHPANQVLLRVDLGAGHAGPSGRYAAWREEAFVLAVVLAFLGLANALRP